MVVTRTVITVGVVGKLGIRLLRLSWGDEHMLVCGGRLISRGKGNSVTGFRALGFNEPQPFTPDQFPVNFEDWVAGDHPEVKVEEWKVGRLADGSDGPGMFPCGRLRAGLKLFTVRESQAVIEWIRRQS